MACGPVGATPEEATQRWNAVAVRLAAAPSAQTTGPLVITDPAMVQAIADELGIGHDRAKVTYLLERMEAHWQASRAAALQYAQELRYADEKRGRV